MLARLNGMAKRSWRRWLRNALILVIAIYGMEIWQSRQMTRGALPDFLRLQSLPTLEGHTRSLWSPDKYTVLYIFAPWCGACRRSGANIKALPSDRFHALALALSWEDLPAVAAFVQETDLRVPVLMGREQEESALAIHSFPSYLIIDREGKIVRAWSGYTTTLGLLWKSYAASF